MHRVLWALLVGAAPLPLAAAEFVNRDFESFAGTGSDLLPGWQVVPPEAALPFVDAVPLASAGVGLVSRHGFSQFQPFEGDYAALLSAGQEDQNLPAGTLLQTGVVPADATHLRLHCRFFEEPALALAFSLGPLDLLAGEYRPESEGWRTYEIALGNLPGTEQTISFAAAYVFTPGFPPAIPVLLDGIEFFAVPEGSAAVGWGVALAAVALGRARRGGARRPRQPRLSRRP